MGGDHCLALIEAELDECGSADGVTRSLDEHLIHTELRMLLCFSFRNPHSGGLEINRIKQSIDIALEAIDLAGQQHAFGASIRRGYIQRSAEALFGLLKDPITPEVVAEECAQGSTSPFAFGTGLPRCFEGQGMPDPIDQWVELVKIRGQFPATDELCDSMHDRSGRRRVSLCGLRLHSSLEEPSAWACGDRFDDAAGYRNRCVSRHDRLNADGSFVHAPPLAGIGKWCEWDSVVVDGASQLGEQRGGRRTIPFVVEMTP